MRNRKKGEVILKMKIITVNNPAIDYFLAKFRDETSGTYDCNMCVEAISIFLAGEASKFLETKVLDIKTPLGIKKCSIIQEEVVLVPVLRAGVSMLSGFQKILPESSVGFIWAHRNTDAKAELDKYKFPANAHNKTIIFLDTMLATGGTISLCCDIVKQYQPKRILCAAILAIPTGMNNLSRKLDAVLTAGVSDKLDSNLYVYPGVGDSGDRLYG